MVHKHRSAQKATITKDISPMRNTNYNKIALSSSPVNRNDFYLKTNLTLPSAAPQQSSNSSMWKYNEMVNNKREQFNSLHFC
ncbi:uncharacterized protein LOC119689187 [Teleopsis dalmanni]|uniref:uncharacterized protein LOC119689187 n=1 Tax=Teleopsis dalmanni TaxID=139649 RepID=UPI0018CD2E1A|nr:uncharacterized protein LOC119689187 [Teleopsis dalmanni]